MMMNSNEVIGVIVVFLFSFIGVFLNIKKTIKDETAEMYKQQASFKAEVETRIKANFAEFNGLIQSMTNSINTLNITVAKLNAMLEHTSRDMDSLHNRISAHGHEIDELSKQNAVMASQIDRSDRRLTKLESK